MSHYRDHLDAARARIETLEAKLKEREAALAARDAELAEVRAEVERLRGGSGDDGPPDGPQGRAGGQRALLVALAVCGFATATGYAMVRPAHCPQRGAPYPASAEVLPRSHDGHDAWSSRADAARLRVGRAAGAALEHGRVRAQRCWQPDGPSGEGSVTVTFAPSGDAQVELDGPPYAGTEVGECVVDAFRAAASRVPSFDWEPLTLTTRFSL
ncbi:hypothetical protein WME98_13830 [Sorangium sp. So ce296]|uniref:hypothetical protein n=1 Tax=Sorangium sp. So ce296 TaxID=3133296 RepID=UPI003F5EC9E5